MEAFATVAQYKALYETDKTDKELEAWLGKASRYIRGELDASSIDYQDQSEDYQDSLSDVCCDVTHRAIGDDDDGYAIPAGATQVNMSGGSYSRGVSFGSSGYSSMFLTASERDMLGIGVPKACVVSPYGGV